jgi:uncharacterized OsmC-like protein
LLSGGKSQAGLSERGERRLNEPCELGGTNRSANPQEHLLAALNACMIVGYAAQCAVRGITLESLTIETDGERSTCVVSSESIQPCNLAMTN